MIEKTINNKLSLFYISTNEIWSGSEELWYSSAKDFINKKAQVSIATRYQNKHIINLKEKNAQFFQFQSSQTLFQKLLRVINRTNNSYTSSLEKKLRAVKPNIVIISQGGNLASLEIMELCIYLKIGFVTITQLVAEVHLLSLNMSNYDRFLSSYQKAFKNYFVSKANLDLHDSILGFQFNNSEIIYNPAFLNDNYNTITFPKNFDKYRIAFVGRIEFFHKGLDLLLKVISKVKWQKRNIEFNFYGNGPHVDLLKNTIKKLEINNCFYFGYFDDVVNIWETNQILILPSRMEGQALSLLEAIKCERTAILTNVGGASEIIEDNISGFIAHQISEDGLDEAMERAWAKRDHWNELGKIAAKNLSQKTPKNPTEFLNCKIVRLLN